MVGLGQGETHPSCLGGYEQDRRPVRTTVPLALMIAGIATMFIFGSSGGGREISGCGCGAICGVIRCATCSSRCRTTGCTRGGIHISFGFVVIGAQYAAKNNTSMEWSVGPRRVRFAPLAEILFPG